jgi:hypothetical protein
MLTAVLMLVLAYGFVVEGLPIFHAAEITPRACGHGKGAWICELINLAWSFVPASVQGEIEGTSALLAAGFLVYFAWLLAKPVLQRARKAHSP